MLRRIWNGLRRTPREGQPSQPPSWNSGKLILDDRKQEAAFDRACHLLEVIRTGEFRWGPGRKSRGAMVTGQDGTPTWLKVLGTSEPAGARWQGGEAAAGRIYGIPKPRLLREMQWWQEGAQWQGLWMTFVPVPVVSSSGRFIDARVAVGIEWLRELRTALNVLGATPTARPKLDEETFRRRLKDMYGVMTPELQIEWSTAHGDLKWGNVTAPELYILDWEGWGRAPKGFDAATLLAFTAGASESFSRIESVFADDLESPTGVAIRLYIFGKRLSKFERGSAEVTKVEYNFLKDRAAELLARSRTISEAYPASHQVR